MNGAATNIAVCPSCGEHNAPRAAVCVICGAALSISTAPPAPPTVSSYAPESSPTATPHRFVMPGPSITPAPWLVVMGCLMVLAAASFRMIPLLRGTSGDSGSGGGGTVQNSTRPAFDPRPAESSSGGTTPSRANSSIPDKSAVGVDQRSDAFFKAASIGDTNTTLLQIAQGVDVNARTSKGEFTALMLASNRGHVDTVKGLIGKGANVNAAGQKGFTALILTAGRPQPAAVRELIAGGADVRGATNDGTTALNMAATYGFVENVKILLEAGADPNAKTSEQLSPLIIASHRGHTEVVRLLIANGADINIKDQFGNTPLAFAEKAGHTEIAQLLRAAGAT